MKDSEMSITEVNPTTSLCLCEGIYLNYRKPMPNIWFRFWQRVFLGFKYDKIK